jgi:hypothetical protein
VHVRQQCVGVPLPGDHEQRAERHDEQEPL